MPFNKEEYMKAWRLANQGKIKQARLANKEKAKEQNAAWYEANKEEAKLKQRLYYAANSDKKKASCAVWEKANLAKRKEAAAEWYQSNKLRKQQYQALYDQEHPDVRKAKFHAYRSRQLLAEGSFTAQEFSDLKKLYGNVCLRCKVHETLTPLEADHVVPLSKGGSNYISNIQPLCRSCNAFKLTKVIDYRTGAECNVHTIKGQLTGPICRKTSTT